MQALSFMFEYIGEMGKDYINAVTPLLEDALMDRDLVHRQTAASVVGHMSLGVAGLGCEAPLVHLLNYVWPNIFEVSPHVVQVKRRLCQHIAVRRRRVADAGERRMQVCSYGQDKGRLGEELLLQAGLKTPALWLRQRSEIAWKEYWTATEVLLVSHMNGV